MTDTPASDTATLATLYDDTRRAPNRVDIRQAEAEFTQLQRQFTRSDYEDRPQSSTPKPEHLHKDIEKVSSDDVEAEERFDLREYLTSSNDASQAAGIKHKHVGVTWDDLEVTGIGGEDNKVKFPFHAGFVFRPPDGLPQIYAPTFLAAIFGAVMFPVMLTWGLISPLLPTKYTPAPPTRTIIHK